MRVKNNFGALLLQGKLTCEERVLLRSDKAAEQKLAISLEDVTNHKELASCFTQRKWSDLPRTPLDYNVRQLSSLAEVLTDLRDLDLSAGAHVGRLIT